MAFRFLDGGFVEPTCRNNNAAIYPGIAALLLERFNVRNTDFPSAISTLQCLHELMVPASECDHDIELAESAGGLVAALGRSFYLPPLAVPQRLLDIANQNFEGLPRLRFLTG